MATLFDPDKVFLQRFLRAGGYYKGDIDGLLGEMSQAAIAKFEADTALVADELGTFHQRSEKCIRTMLLPTQRKARKFLASIDQAGLSAGMTVRIISGTRTYAEQAELYKIYQNGGALAAPAGSSNHNFGIGWDVGVFNAKGEYIDDLIKAGKMTSTAVDAEYKKAGAYGRGQGLFWGGDWKKKKDYPHYQLLDNDVLPTVREKFEKGGGPYV